MGAVKSKVMNLLDRGSHVKVPNDKLSGTYPLLSRSIQSEPDTVTHLSITHTTIQSVPGDIELYHNITTLDLSHNLIEVLPWFLVYYLKQLQILNLSHNQLKELPATTFYLPQLLSLDLSYNLIERLPNDLLLFKKLETLQVQGNDNLVSPPLELCCNGKAAIFAELRKRKSRSDAWARWKPFYTSQFTCLRSLLELCIDAIIYSKLDYLSATTIPPTVKNYLSTTEKFQSSSIPSLMKCSTCRAYFTKEVIFDNHVCYERERRGVYLNIKVTNKYTRDAEEKCRGKKGDNKVRNTIRGRDNKSIGRITNPRAQIPKYRSNWNSRHNSDLESEMVG